MADQKPREGQHGLAIGWSGAVHEDNCRMPGSGAGSNQSTGQLHVSVRETDLFPFLDLDAPCDTLSSAVALPYQGSHPAGAVPLKLYSGFNRRLDRDRRAGEEAVALGRVKSPDLTGFIESNELIRPGELVPQLEI